MVKTRRNKKKKVHNYAEGYYNLEDDDWDDEDWEDEEQKDSDEDYVLVEEDNTDQEDHDYILEEENSTHENEDEEYKDDEDKRIGKKRGPSCTNMKGKERNKKRTKEEHIIDNTPEICELRWREATSKSNQEKRNKKYDKKNESKYVSKGGKKAVDKIPKTRVVVPALRPLGYKEIAKKTWFDKMSCKLKYAYDQIRRSNFKLHSRKITKNNKDPALREKIKKKKKELDDTMQILVERFLDTDFLHDDLKASNCNPAVPASYAPSAFNVYYSRLVGKDEKRQMEDKEGYSLAWSYGSGSGGSTIGLNPSTRKVFKATKDEFVGSIADKALTLMEELMRLDPQYDEQLGENHLNVLSVKVYWGEKRVNEHNDIDMSKYSGPKKNNSQKPGTPVLIYTVGDPKKLIFHRRQLVPAAKHSGYDFKPPLGIPKGQPNPEDIVVGQFHKDAFILVFADEDHEGGYYWVHSSNTDDLIAPGDSYYRGFTISFMGRSCIHQILINDRDNTVFSEMSESQKKKNIRNRGSKSNHWL